MGKKSKQEHGVSNRLITSIVSDVFERNGINPSEVTIPEEKKKEIKALVSDLSKQVKDFTSKQKKKKK
ncbi:hypothetical protein [Bacillus rubiinfantis]|uniref:hypothetical protein n=1 Tax=Bacillus rubiinfantis TaxID=1499680 RepID=UPI0005AB75CC|nr:hypothetical protein [Bacillus rubiinfantis]